MKIHAYTRLAIQLLLIFILLSTINSIVLALENPVIFPQLGHYGYITSTAFSPDGKYAISSCLFDNRIKLWDVKSGREINTYSGHSGIEVNPITFSPDGKHILSASSDNAIKLWDINTGVVLKQITSNSAINSIAFSPNGKHMLSANNDKTIKLWDLATGNEIRAFHGHLGSVRTVVFSPDGMYMLSGGDDAKIKLWSIKTGQEIYTLSSHTSKITSAKFSKNGKYILSVHYDGSFKVWDSKSGKELSNYYFKTNSKYTSSIAADFSSCEEYIIAGSDNNKIIILDHKRQNLVFSYFGNKEINERFIQPFITISPDGNYFLYSSGANNAFSLWNFTHKKKIHEFIGNVNEANSVAVTKDAKYFLAGYSNGYMIMWEISSGKIVREYRGHSSSINSVTISPDGKYALTASSDKLLILWEISTGKKIRTFSGHYKAVNNVVFTPDGRYALSGSEDKSLKLWDFKKGTVVRTFKGHTDNISNLSVSSDGKYVLSGSWDKTMKLWRISTGDLIRNFKEHSDVVDIVTFSHNNHYLFSWSRDRVLRQWEMSSGKLIQTKYDTSIISAKLFDNLIISKELEKKLNQLNYNSDRFRDINYILGSQNIILVSRDGTIFIGDKNTGKQITHLTLFSDGEWIAITPDGYYNASPNGDKHLNVRIGNNVYGIENYREAFFRPDLVKIALSGGSLKSYRNIADVKQPPRVEIIDTPLTVVGDELTVKLKLTDIGGGIGDVRLYLNGSAIMLDNSRGLKVVDKGISRNYKIRLARGDNIIRAVAFNADNTMLSNPAEQTVTATYTSTTKPTLHALVIGINEFKNPKLRLQYAVPDVHLFTETLKKGASDLFGKVNIVSLTTPEQTTSDYIASELKKMRSINPDDLFILFVASHGTVDDGEYFLLTSNVGSTSTAKLKTDALSQNKLKELIANIPATKKVIVLDTCNAGQMGDALQVAMLTRGMSEDTAFKILSRAVGSTILSSATSTQEALEGYQGHGLFTWVLAEGMKGKADKGKTGLIKTTDLVDYVESEVPEIAEKYFRRKQYPTTAVSGQGFPIGKSGL